MSDLIIFSGWCILFDVYIFKFFLFLRLIKVWVVLIEKLFK